MNLSAIIWENGSEKSSLLEFILNNISDFIKINTPYQDFFFIVKQPDAKIKIFTNDNFDIKTTLPIEFFFKRKKNETRKDPIYLDYLIQNPEIDKTKYIYYSNYLGEMPNYNRWTVSFAKHIATHNVFDISSNYLLDNIKNVDIKNSLELFRLADLKRQTVFLTENKQIKLPFATPKSINIKFWLPT